MRCGTTRMTVSDRYMFGVRRDSTAAPAAIRMNGTMISHARRFAMPRMSSGVYFFPGITCLSSRPEQDAVPRQAHAHAVPRQLARDVGAAERPRIESMSVVEVLRVDRRAPAERRVESETARPVAERRAVRLRRG